MKYKSMSNFALKDKNIFLFPEAEIAKTVEIAKAYAMGDDKIKTVIKNQFNICLSNEQINKYFILGQQLRQAKIACTESVN